MHKLVVANYKMNGDTEFYIDHVKKFNKLKVKDTDIVLCPPFVYLPFFNLKNKKITLGCQDVANVQKGKSTGQVSAEMLKEFNVNYAIVGHSERRSIGETNDLVADKVKVCFDNGIEPIICIGGSSKTVKESFLKNQIETALSKVQNKRVIFAYEPLWAIGSGLVPTIDNINQASKIIKDVCTSLNFVPVVLYGGSVDDNNYKELIKANIDGFLVGGTSLKIDKFINLIKGVENE